jgi:deoxyadenosine/deoxycytidine kinase
MEDFTFFLLSFIIHFILIIIQILFTFKRKKKVFIAILGNIGAGKSILCKNLLQYYTTTKHSTFYNKTRIIFESLNKRYLDQYYEDIQENWFW